MGDAVVTSGRSIVGLPMPRSEAWMGWWTTMVDRLEEGLEEGNDEKRKGRTVLKRHLKSRAVTKFGFRGNKCKKSRVDKYRQDKARTNQLGKHCEWGQTATRSSES